MVKIKMLGVSGSPRERSNTTTMVKTALDAAGKIGGVETELILLSKCRVEPCRGDQSCWNTKSLRCLLIKDDMEEIYPKLMDADGIIMGTPVYFGTISGQLKVFMDRTTCLGGTRKLNGKVGAAIATGGQRHGGQEFAMVTIHNYFLIHGMFVVTAPPYAYWGVGGVTTLNPDSITKDIWLHAEEHVSTLETVSKLGKKVAEVAKIVKAGSEIVEGR